VSIRKGERTLKPWMKSEAGSLVFAAEGSVSNR
jgi:hypothetical protein